MISVAVPCRFPVIFHWLVSDCFGLVSLSAAQKWQQMEKEVKEGGAPNEGPQKCLEFTVAQAAAYFRVTLPP